MLKGGLVLIWELDMNLEPTLINRESALVSITEIFTNMDNAYVI